MAVAPADGSAAAEGAAALSSAGEGEDAVASMEGMDAGALIGAMRREATVLQKQVDDEAWLREIRAKNAVSNAAIQADIDLLEAELAALKAEEEAAIAAAEQAKRDRVLRLRAEREAAEAEKARREAWRHRPRLLQPPERLM